MWRYSGWSANPASCCGVCVGGDLGGGPFAELDVPAEAAQVQMPGFGLELGGGTSVGCQVLEGRMAKLVERPSLTVRVVGGGGLLEQVLGTRVGQPAASGLRADVRLGRGSRTGHGRAAAGEEH